MLSYQHSFHAGNLADVHKHSILAWTLEYLTRKPKPFSYVETHAGRGLYDLEHPDALKTSEAASGIEKLHAQIPFEHPYSKALSETQKTYGSNFYPGSPMIALSLSRPKDNLHLAELHPQEYHRLRARIPKARGLCYARDGYELALSLCPPTPRRGVLFIDPSYELASDYASMSDFIAKIVRRWNVGVIITWYPLLTTGRHTKMLDRLARQHSEAMRHEVHFTPAKKTHGMIGSGMFIVNPPFGLDQETRRLSQVFNSLKANLN